MPDRPCRRVRPPDRQPDQIGQLLNQCRQQGQWKFPVIKVRYGFDRWWRVHGTHQQTRLGGGTGKDESDRLARAIAKFIARARRYIRKLDMNWRICESSRFLWNRVGCTLAFLEIHWARSHEASERKSQEAEVHAGRIRLIDLVFSRVLFNWHEELIQTRRTSSHILRSIFAQANGENFGRPEFSFFHLNFPWPIFYKATSPDLQEMVRTIQKQTYLFVMFQIVSWISFRVPEPEPVILAKGPKKGRLDLYHAKIDSLSFLLKRVINLN